MLVGEVEVNVCLSSKNDLSLALPHIGHLKEKKKTHNISQQ